MRELSVCGRPIDSGPTVLTMRWTFDELFARATVERDIEKRKKLYAEFQQILSQDVPVAFTHVWSRRYAARKEVLNTPEGIWGTAAPYDQVDLA